MAWRSLLDHWLVIAAAAGAALVALQARSNVARPSSPAPLSSGTRLLRRALVHPWIGFISVCLLLFLNQILFNVYVRVAHGGDAGFVARYLPRFWFALAQDAPPVEWLARGMSRGTADMLSMSVLRVNAFLELPFTLFAYLSAGRLFGVSLYRALLRLAPLAAASFTITFSAVELALRNPWTNDDLIIRAIACVVFIVFHWWRARREGPGALVPPPTDARAGRLLLALAGTALLGVVVLAMYDLTLLYNLGHWSRSHLGAILIVATIGLTAIFAAVHALEARASKTSISTSTSISPPREGGAVLWFGAVLQVFIALFFVPSLPIRYRMSSPLSRLTAATLIVLALVAGGALGVRALRRRDLSIIRAAISLLIGLSAGAALAALVRLPSLTGEDWLLGKAALLLVPALLISVALDSLLARKSAA